MYIVYFNCTYACSTSNGFWKNKHCSQILILNGIKWDIYGTRSWIQIRQNVFPPDQGLICRRQVSKCRRRPHFYCLKLTWKFLSLSSNSLRSLSAVASRIFRLEISAIKSSLCVSSDDLVISSWNDTIHYLNRASVRINRNSGLSGLGWAEGENKFSVIFLDYSYTA